MTEREPYDRIFRRGGGVITPFQDELWPILLFPEFLPRKVSGYFEPLSLVARDLGDHRVYLADEQDTEHTYTTSWNPKKFAEERFRIPLGALMFGDSSRWGAVLTDEGFTCIGGQPDVIRRVEEALGGREAVRQAFAEWLTSAEGLEFSSEKAVALGRLNRWDPVG